MRPWLLSAVAAVGLGILPAALAQQAADSAPSLPDCATECLGSALGDSSCEPTDQECICQDDALQEEVTICVTASCSSQEALITKNATSIACNAPVRDRSAYLEGVAIALGALMGVVIIFRLVYRLVSGLGWGLDDWFILVTGLVSSPNVAITTEGTIPNGLGRDVWTLSFDQITQFGKYFYIQAVLYFAEVTLLKMSILFFYLRIFPERKVRRVLYATLAVNAMAGVAYVIAAIFQCWPISYNWTRWDQRHEGKCINITALTWSNAIVSIVFDFWMLAIPLSQLRKLKLHWKRKIGVGLMFGVGIFVTIVSILRLTSLVEFAKSQSNPTWKNSNVSNWSFIEINVGVVCACMPTLRLALVRCFRVFRETTVRSHTGYNSHNKELYHRQASTRGNASRAMATSDGERPTSPHGVLCQKSFAVEYSQEDDVNLVPMRDLHFSGDRSVKSASSRSM